MNFIDLNNFITKLFIKYIQIYKDSENRIEIYNSIDITKIGGKIRQDILYDKKIFDKLQYYENIYKLYNNNTSELLQEYVKIIMTPVNKTKLEKIEKNKLNILHKYLKIIKLIVPYDFFIEINVNDNDIILNKNYCENCNNSEKFLKDNDTVVCCNCFSEIIKLTYFNNRSYNLSINKCNYDRITHFKECIKQYQGKQNTFINPKVYTDLEKALILNGIITDDNKLSKEEKFKNVNKNHILYFLKELGYNKHYDDYILIHSQLTGRKPNNITYLENLLINDFEKISEKYSILYKNIDRKNFINIQFILYRLLIKHNHNFDADDFIAIKSIDQKMERDKICRMIFKELGWEYSNN